MQEHFLYSLMPLLFSSLWCNHVFTCKNILYTRSVGLLFPWVQCQTLKPVLSQCCQTSFVTVDDFIALYTPSYVFYSHGCKKFLHARTFFYTLIPLLFKCSYVFYSHGCNVRAWNLFWASVAKPVLRQLMILLSCTLAHTFYIPMGAINLYIQEHFLYSLIWSHQFLLC